MRKVSTHQRLHEQIRDIEQKLRKSFEKDVGPELKAADFASSTLATVLVSIDERSGELELDEHGTPIGGDVEVLQLYALQLIGARAFRVMRAARGVLASGYEAESRAHDRIIIELEAHREAILGDPSGAEAKAWLEGDRAYGIGKRVKERSTGNMYSNLSMDSHGDPRPLARLLDLETGRMELRPERTPATRACLLMHAGFARDQALAIATAAGIFLTGLGQLDAAITAGWAKFD